LSQEWEQVRAAARSEAAAHASASSSASSSHNTTMSDIQSLQIREIPPPHKKALSMQPEPSPRMTPISMATKTKSDDDMEVVVVVTGTEMRRNFLFAYTVYKIKVCITFPKELAKCYIIFRSYSDFSALDSKLRMVFDKDLPPGFPELPQLKWFGSLEPEYVQYLTVQLREFLSKLMQIPSISQTKLVMGFLRDDGLSMIDLASRDTL
jgi:hypothetical protein